MHAHAYTAPRKKNPQRNFPHTHESIYAHTLRAWTGPLAFQSPALNPKKTAALPPKPVTRQVETTAIIHVPLRDLPKVPWEGEEDYPDRESSYSMYETVRHTLLLLCMFVDVWTDTPT